MQRWQLQLLIIVSAAAGWAILSAQDAQRLWLAGDSHIHSHWSADYDERKDPPEALLGIDGRYATPVNAHQARQHGLAWMVTTDHGGPNHSKLNLTRAYAELKASRAIVPRPAAVLRDGTEHAGHGSPHADHPEQRAGGRRALRDREPVRFSGCLARRSRPQCRRPRPGGRWSTSEHCRCFRCCLQTIHRVRRRALACMASTSRESSAATTTSRRRCIAEWKAHRGTRRPRSPLTALRNAMRPEGRQVSAGPMEMRGPTPSAASIR